MSITTGTLFRKTIDTIADGSTYRKPTIDEISKLKADGNFFGDIYESTGTDKIIDAISSYIMSVSTGDTLFDLNPSGSGDASLENILLFGEGGRIFLADQTLDFINASGTEIIGRGIRVWESDSKYAKLAFENDAAVLEVVGGTITGGAVQTSSGIEQRVVIDGSDNTLKFYDDNNDVLVKIDDNIWGIFPGMVVTDGVIYLTHPTSSSYTVLKENYLNILSDGTPTKNSIDIAFNWVNQGINTVDFVALEVSFWDNTSTPDTGERIGVQGKTTIYNASCNLDGIGIYGYGFNAGSNLAIGGRFRSADIAVRMEFGSTDHVDFKVDTNGYLNIIPSGDKLILWESGGVANDSTQMWTDTDGIFNLKPDGDRVLLWEHSEGGGDVTHLWTDTAGYFNIRPLGSNVTEKGYIRIWDRAEGASDYTDIWTNANADFNIKPMGDGVMIWESAGGAGHYGHMYANTSGVFTIEGGSGGIVFIDDHLNVSGAYRMDGNDIISTSAQQTGSFITRTYVSFGRDANLTRTNPGSTTADAATVDGSINLQGYRMIRAGVVTGISGQFITSARASDDTITFTVQKNGVNQSMVATKTITGLGGTGCISTANSFSVAAEDTVNVEITLTAGDVGTVTVSNIAIAVEMLI